MIIKYMENGGYITLTTAYCNNRKGEGEKASSAIMDAKNSEPHIFKERKQWSCPDPCLERGAEFLTMKRTWQENLSSLEE